MREKRLIIQIYNLTFRKMPRICYFTWKKTSAGNQRSHAMNATKRKFRANLITKKIKLWDWTTARIKVCSKVYKKLKGFI